MPFVTSQQNIPDMLSQPPTSGDEGTGGVSVGREGKGRGEGGLWKGRREGRRGGGRRKRCGLP